MLCTSYLILTPCRQVTQKCLIAIPCVVDGSRISAFSYTMSCTCVCQLICLTYRFKVINSLLQAAWVSSYKQKDRSWPPIFRTIILQQTDHSFRYSLCFPSVAIMALHRTVLQEDDILCELYVDTRSDVSNLVTMKVWAVTVMSPQLVQVNNCDLLLVH